VQREACESFLAREAHELIKKIKKEEEERKDHFDY
jgi:hypothetical protein